jgi:hypothetical protein
LRESGVFRILRNLPAEGHPNTQWIGLASLSASSGLQAFALMTRGD